MDDKVNAKMDTKVIIGVVVVFVLILSILAVAYYVNINNNKVAVESKIKGEIKTQRTQPASIPSFREVQDDEIEEPTEPREVETYPPHSFEGGEEEPQEEYSQDTPSTSFQPSNYEESSFRGSSRNPYDSVGVEYSQQHTETEEYKPMTFQTSKRDAPQDDEY